MADPIDELLKPELAKEAGLRQQVDNFTAALDRARRDLAAVQARIKGIRDAADVLRAGPAQKRSRGPVTRNRGMSDHWQKIMQLVDLTFEVFTYNDLADTAARAGHQASPETLRSQMSDYKGRGWVQPAGIGAFSLTDNGRRAAGIHVLEVEKDKASDGGTPEAFGRVAELDGPEKTEQHPFRKGENVGSSPTPPSSRPEPASFDSDLDDDVPF